MLKTVKELFEFAVNLAFHSPYKSTSRLRVVKGILWFLAGAAATVGVARMINGLGAATNLTDITPWGLWIGFDVVGGVALAAGGFVIAATVYIFHMERYHPILRPAVLTAFLGYGAVIVGLIFDIGLPWNIFMVIFNWQHHSALFEVAWCVILYFTVLSFEFAPVVLEKMPFPRLFRLFKTLTLPLVIFGIILSTLHQSSLGTLFLIMPFRLDPLWYSSIQPHLFFISAIGLGLSMVTLESLVSSWLYNREPEIPILQGLARAASIVLGIYAVIRIGDLAINGKLSLLFEPRWESGVYVLELLLCAVIPAVLFGIPGIRKHRAGLWTAAGMAVAGFVFNRINVSGISTITTTGTDYIPAWTEFAISVGIVAGAMLVFFFFVEHFSVYEEEAHEKEKEEEAGLPHRDPVSGTFLGSPWSGDSYAYSLILIFGAAIAIFLLPEGAVEGARPEPTPVETVKTVKAIRAPAPGKAYSHLVLEGSENSGPMRVQPVFTHLLDANRDGRFVLFDHMGHQERQGGKDSCRVCHHMNRPFDQATPCTACHNDMYLARDAFDHDLHQVKMGGNDACIKCHTDLTLPKNRETTAPCMSCHRDMAAEESMVRLKDAQFLAPAPGYMDAMHGLCVTCHERTLAGRPGLGADFARCAACHQETDPDFLKRLPSYPAVEKDQLVKGKEKTVVGLRERELKGAQR